MPPIRQQAHPPPGAQILAAQPQGRYGIDAGAIGISGAPGSQLDEACAQKAIDAVLNK